MATYEPISGTSANNETVDWDNLTGWNFTETAGAAARVLLRDGGSGGDIVVDVKLASGQSVGENYARPIRLDGGSLFVDIDTGTVRGAVYGE